MNSLAPLSTPDNGTTLPDGSMIVTPEQLARLGNGDVKRGRRELGLMLAATKDRTIHSGPTKRPANVRLATVADEEKVLALVLRDLQENASKIAPIDEERVLDHIQAGTQKRGGIVIVIDGPDRSIIAVGIMIPCQWWFSKSYYVCEMLNYVHPDHRRSNHINDLLAYERWVGDFWSKDFGYRIFVLFGVLATKRVKEKVMLYRRKFALTGASFLYPSPFEDSGS
jgi:hypothetical protein